MNELNLIMFTMRSRDVERERRKVVQLLCKLIRKHC